MRILMLQNTTPLTGMLLIGAALAAYVPPVAAEGQIPDQKDSSHSIHARDKQTARSGSLAAQLRELQSKVAALEVALAQRHQAAATHASQQGGQTTMSMHGMSSGQLRNMQTMRRGMMGGSMGMISRDMMSGINAMPLDGMEMTNIQGMLGMGMTGRDGLTMMGRMRDSSQGQMASSLPGFPGASHIYHIGAIGFFLDHLQHISLSAEQQVALNRIKEQTLLDQAASQRRLEEVEQELWTLTASDQPDAQRIESKVREIEKLQGDQRLAFIRAVGEAAKLLTDDQRTTLLGIGAAEQPDTQHNR